jgi:hypothetical protein
LRHEALLASSCLTSFSPPTLADRAFPTFGTGSK